MSWFLPYCHQYGKLFKTASAPGCDEPTSHVVSIVSNGVDYISIPANASVAGSRRVMNVIDFVANVPQETSISPLKAEKSLRGQPLLRSGKSNPKH